MKTRAFPLKKTMIGKMLTDEEQFEYCKICQKKKIDFKVGLVCSLTNTRRTFQTSCNDYVEDKEAAEKKRKMENELQGALEKINTPKSQWRIVIGIIVALIALIRIILRMMD